MYGVFTTTAGTAYCSIGWDGVNGSMLVYTFNRTTFAWSKTSSDKFPCTVYWLGKYNI